MSRILVVDDEVAVRLALRKFLEARKHEVILASNGKEGLDAAAKYRPDMILLDINMPDMDGLTVLKTLKETKSTALIPVIMLTGVDTDECVKEAMHWYTEQYIVKPCEQATLHAAIERVLAARRK